MITALAGCDGYIAVKGTVYEWNNPPRNAAEKIIVDKQVPFDFLDVTPIVGAKVTVFHGGDYGKKELAEDTIWQRSQTTNSEGFFNIGDVTAPSKFTAIIRAQKEGYQKVETKFLHDKLMHEAIILLIKNPLVSTHATQTQ
ncbi:MAG: hypothetical protein HZA20_10400 [Nitrospirae bacterium]|nr:hypothetical protein [Nitrospirota bacterium]